MYLLTVVLFALGVACLIIGANLLILGASRLAIRMGISAAVVGLTVVAFGTGAPELAVGIEAALSDRPDIALGNVIGSNIVNVFLVLGTAALVSPITVSRCLLSRDVPAMIAVSILFLVIAFDGRIGRLEAVVMLGCFAIYSVWALSRGKTQADLDCDTGFDKVPEHESKRSRSLPRNLLMLVGGLALLFIGSRWVVGGAVALARYLGMSELMVSLTIVAASTSLPEVATTIVAGVRKQSDLGIGNVIGSNIFNILVVLGCAGLLAKQGITIPPESIYVDIPVMIFAAVACLPIFFTGEVISRWEGALFLFYYACYDLYLILACMNSTILPYFKGAMIRAVIPITAILVLVPFYTSWKRRRTS